MAVMTGCVSEKKNGAENSREQETAEEKPGRTDSSIIYDETSLLAQNRLKALTTSTTTRGDGDNVNPDNGNTLAAKVRRFQAGEIALTPEDFIREGILRVNNDNLGLVTDQLPHTPFSTINTPEKLVLWLNTLIPEEHVILLFGASNLPNWRQSIQRDIPPRVSLYGFELNNSQAGATFFRWEDGEILGNYSATGSNELWQQRSLQLRDSLMDVARTIAGAHPSASWHWISLLPEAPDGHFLSGNLNHTHFHDLLTFWTRILREKNIGLLDVSQNGNKASLTDIDNGCRYADEILYTDTAEAVSSSPDEQTLLLGDFFEAIRENSLEASLPLDLLRTHGLKMDSEQLQAIDHQTVYLMDCKRFIHFKRQLKNLTGIKPTDNDPGIFNNLEANADLFEYLESTEPGHFDTLSGLFLDAVRATVSNRHPEAVSTRHGITMPANPLIRAEASP